MDSGEQDAYDITGQASVRDGMWGKFGSSAMEEDDKAGESALDKEMTEEEKNISIQEKNRRA